MLLHLSDFMFAYYELVQPCNFELYFQNSHQILSVLHLMSPLGLELLYGILLTTVSLYFEHSYPIKNQVHLA